MAVFEMVEVINAPVSKVMSLANDAQRRHEFVPGGISVEVVPARKGRVGEVWTLTSSMMGMRSRAKATILEWVDGKRVVWKHEGGFECRETQLYEPTAEGGARYAFRVEFRVKGTMRFLGPLVVLMTKRMMRRGGAKLKRICETEAGTPGA
jgi:hypothetical protein